MMDDQDRFSDQAEALVASDIADQTAAYLNKGRYLANGAEAEIKDLWIARFRSSLTTHDKRDVSAYEDAAAELRLRGITVPAERVDEQPLSALRRDGSHAGAFDAAEAAIDDLHEKQHRSH